MGETQACVGGHFCSLLVTIWAVGKGTRKNRWNEAVHPRLGYPGETFSAQLPSETIQPAVRLLRKCGRSEKATATKHMTCIRDGKLPQQLPLAMRIAGYTLHAAEGASARRIRVMAARRRRRGPSGQAAMTGV